MNNNMTPTTKTKPFAYFIIFFAGIGGMLYGYDLGVISGALIFMQTSLHLNEAELSSIVAAVLGGGAVATLITGYLADKFGRRTMISIAGGIFIIGVLLVIFSNTFDSILAGRLVQGIGIGIITIIIPLYLTEAAPSSIRGRSVTVFQLFLTGGILLAFLVDLVFTPSGNWRGMFACVLVPGILLFLGSFCLTKSPRWLYSQGRQQEAFEALKKSHSREEAELDIKEMQQVNLERTNLSITKFFTKLCQRKYLIPFLIALAVACLNQLTGINSILQFSTLILKSTGISTNFISMLGSVGVGLINFIVTIIAISLIDKVGRKPLLTVGTAGTMLALFYSGFICFLPDSPLKGALLALGLFIFILFFAIGPGVVVWLALSELLPMAIRSKGMAICLFVNSAVSSILASIFLVFVRKAGYESVFFLCGICTIFYFLLSAFILPETKNETLEEIELHFEEASKKRHKLKAQKKTQKKEQL